MQINIDMERLTEEESKQKNKEIFQKYNKIMSDDLAYNTKKLIIGVALGLTTLCEDLNHPYNFANEIEKDFESGKYDSMLKMFEDKPFIHQNKDAMSIEEKLFCEFLCKMNEIKCAKETIKKNNE